jgi:hypothetical protein
VLGDPVAFGEGGGRIEALADLLVHGFTGLGLARVGEFRVDQNVLKGAEQRWLLERQGAQERVDDAFLGQEAGVLADVLRRCQRLGPRMAG